MRISDWSSDVCSSDLGVLFGLFAAINYWWPKAFGYKLDVFWGKVSFWCWVVGFWVAFTPLYILGLMGVTRRMRVFDAPSLQIWFVIAGIGAAIVAAGMGAMLVQFAVKTGRAACRVRVLQVVELWGVAESLK